MVATRLLNLLALAWLALGMLPSAWAQGPLSDPMRPALPHSAPSPAPAVAAVKAVPTEAVSPVQNEPQVLPQLQGIVRSGSLVRVLVDGQLLVPGTVSGPYRVLAVHRDKVDLQWQGRTLSLSLYPDVGRMPVQRGQDLAPFLPSRPEASSALARNALTPPPKTATSTAAGN